MSLRCLFLAVVLVNAGLTLGSGSIHRRYFHDLSPRSPRLEFESDGGRVETWGGSGSGVFEDASVAACRVVLKPRGLWLPSYTDSSSLHVVTRGAGRVGIVTPFSDRRVEKNTFKVVKGDVIAVPRGYVVWMYNDEDRDMEIVGVADVRESTRAADLRAFYLTGAKKERREDDEREQSGYSGIVHGFSKDVLARAWEMDTNTVRELVESQSEAGIVRLDKDITFQEQDNVFFQNFVYRLDKFHADLRVENGGELRELSSFKFPVLKHLDMGLECMQLEQGAMVAPNWFINAHQVLYVIRGRGRIEAVDNNGEKALDTDLEEGSLVVIPAYFPSTKIASRDESFHYITFVTSHQPVMSFLSGRKSVYRGIPLQVLSRMLNVDEDQAKQIRRAHGRESIIFADDEGARRTFF